MADNTTINTGTGGDVIASDDVTTLNGGASTGIKVQRVKVMHGADGVATDVSAASPMPVSGAISITANSIVSTVNSSAVALGIGGVFTGASEDITEYADIRVTVFADQASAVDGLQIQQSSNGTNWDISDAYSIPTGAGKTFSVAANSKFYRTVYTNGGAAQTVFRLQVKLHKNYSKGSSVRPQDGRANDNDFEESLSYLMVYNGTTWDRQKGDATNGTRMQVAPSISVTATAAAATAVTATLPAAGVGLFHYITGIEIMRTATAALVGTAALVVTSTNIPGGLAWTFGNAMAVGATQKDEALTFASPIKSTAANTATTIVAPLPGAGVIWRINVYYYTGV